MDGKLDEVHFALKFKHGIHTILIFVDSLAPFSEATDTLLAVLRDRYPDGLTASREPYKLTPIPSGDDASTRIVYGLPKNPSELSQGFKLLGGSSSDNAIIKGIQNGATLAFTFVEGSRDKSNIEFPVQVPKLDDDLDMEGEDGMPLEGEDELSD